MKKLLSIVLVLALALMAIPFMPHQSTAAPLPSPSIIDGYENVCLTYHFNPDIGNSTVSQTSADLMPYVAYLDTNRNFQDFFFDSYLFLPWNASAPSGATMHGGTNNPTIASDWTAYVDDVFLKNRNVNALNTAMGRAKSELNDDTKKAGVFFTILYPAYNQNEFGELGGKELDLSKQEDREYAIKWIIDEQLNRFNENGYEHLDLVGFYWLEEEIYSSYDKSMMQYASEYLHSLGLKFIWIPWYQAPGYSEWQNYGFDLACLQPNEIWSSTAMPGRVTDCAKLCKTYGMSMQIETRSETAQQDYYDRYINYLHGGLKCGAMDSVKFYYQGGKTGVYYSACYSDETLYRSVYDLTYLYAKGTLTEEDLGLDEVLPFALPEGVEWVSYGKSYTGCESYTDGNGMGYQNVSGDELTDGVLGTTISGTEWHAYHKSILDEDNRMSTTIDLGEVYTGLTHVMAQFNDYHPYNIGPPSNLKIYISEDGVDFQLLATPRVKHYDNDFYIKYVAKTPFDARYVKMSFTNSTSYNFVFCAEFLIGKQIEDPDNGTSSEDSTEVSDENPSVDSSDESSDISSGESSDETTEDPSEPYEPHVHERNGGWKCDEYSHWYECKCGVPFNIKTHIVSDWKVTVEPTIEADGLKEKRCTICTIVLESETIPKIAYGLGDFNRNGKVDSMDYMLLKRNYFGTLSADNEQGVLGDINKNNKIDAIDYIMIKRIYFGTY